MAIRVDRLTRIAGITGVALALGASAASARPVVLWGCHGPQGQALGTAGLTAVHAADGATAAGDGCQGGTGPAATFSRADPEAGSYAAWRADAPAGTTLTGVRIVRALGASGGAPQRYVARSGAAVLESADLGTPGSDSVALPASGTTVEAGVECAAPSGSRCAAPSPGTVSIASLALEADDAVAPRGSVGGLRSPARGALTLEVDATDDGAGLATARAVVDGQVLATAALDPACGDLDPGTPVRDLTLAACARSASRVPLTIDVGALAPGSHRLQVHVVDAAGNDALVTDGTLGVAGAAVVFTPTVQLRIGDPPPAQAQSGGALVAQSLRGCPHPRLSALLAQRPVRISKGRPVLRRSARYRFRGRLTCRISGARRSAPRGTPVQLLHRVRGRIRLVRTVTTGTSGRFTVRLSQRSSRTLIFRHRAGTGTSQVRIPVLVTHRRPR